MKVENVGMAVEGAGMMIELRRAGVRKLNRPIGNAAPFRVRLYKIAGGG